jgi:hypothetical protein
MTAALSTLDPAADVEREAQVIELRPAPRWHRRLQAGVVLLALPVAVLVTIWVMGRPAAEDRRPVAYSAPIVRVEVVAAPETTAVARRVASVLSTETAEVTLAAVTDPGTGAAAATQVVYYDPAFADEAAEVQQRLGSGTLLLGSVLEERSADVTVVVGKDLTPA